MGEHFLLSLLFNDFGIKSIASFDIKSIAGKLAFLCYYIYMFSVLKFLIFLFLLNMSNLLISFILTLVL